MLWTTFCDAFTAVTPDFSGSLCYIQDKEDMKETLCEGLWKTVGDNPLPVTSK